VTNTSWKLRRNPNYWEKDPWWGEYQMPFVDSLSVVYIKDKSTQQAALRTAKIDLLYGDRSNRAFYTEDYMAMKGTAPDLLWDNTVESRISAIGWRHDVAPFNDLRVRQAMFYATDHDQVSDFFYGGPVFVEPVTPVGHYEWAYTPLEEFPQDIQDLFGYDPERAKQLLAEAGYPDGFKTSVLLSSTAASYLVELMSLVKAQWAEVGVELELNVQESGVAGALTRGYPELPPWEGLHTTSGNAAWFAVSYIYRIPGPGEAFQFSAADHQVTLDYATDAHKLILQEPLSKLDETKTQVKKLTREYTQFHYERALWLPLGARPTYVAWWPYLRGYHGEQNGGYFYMDWQLPYLWLDSDMKFEMTGRRAE